MQTLLPNSSPNVFVPVYDMCVFYTHAMRRSHDNYCSFMFQVTHAVKTTNQFSGLHTTSTDVKSDFGLYIPEWTPPTDPRWTNSETWGCLNRKLYQIVTSQWHHATRSCSSRRNAFNMMPWRHLRDRKLHNIRKFKMYENLMIESVSSILNLISR